MSFTDIRSRSIETLADHYARTRRTRLRPISMAAAIRTIRMVAPDAPESDADLANIIAASAVYHGHPVDFDAG